MAAAVPEHQEELAYPPTDGVTSVRFARTCNFLLVSSWDKTVRLYAAETNQMRHKYEHKAAVFDCAFSEDDSKVFSGGIDRNLVMMDFKTGQLTTLGSHENAIKCLLYNTSTNQVISGSWDTKIGLWDPRSHKPQIASYVVEPNEKIYTMDQNGYRLVVGTHNRHVKIYDIRNMSEPEQTRESSLLNQTRCIRCMPNGQGYALSSIEGRVAIEYFDPNPKVQKRKYAFKCHRKQVGAVQTLYPVNSIAFHPQYGTFATGGCDAVVNVWDGENKKRICLYPTYPTSIAAMDFSNDGKLLAVASSYTFEEGEKDHPNDAVFIRTVNDHEVKPKAPGGQ